ncbi:RnfABCDGE type electron transport complex subunit B [Butyricicoccus sp.]|uniref:RnfABCDGE type electron transport complex subunit B n=1 Tax=Butyricicoccus sp. TaxID=2049021 RepID=UPI003F14D9DF
MMSIVSAVLVLGVMGLLFGLILAFASKIFAVEVDARIPAVQECLPGANCGGCGYAGCNGLATAIVEGKAPVNGCPVGGAAAAEKIAAVLGVEVTESEKMIAHVHCSGTCENAKNRAKYEGIEDCLGAIRVANGYKECAFACLGLGTCEKACPFGAIHVVDGVAKVDASKCTACSKCIAACPKHIISLVPEKNAVRVDCSSKAKGKEVMDACSVGCIGCGLCEKTCKFDAIHMEGNLPVIDYDKCKGCQMCAKACPRHIIEPWNTPEKVKELQELKAKQAAAKKAAMEKAAAAKKAQEAASAPADK